MEMIRITLNACWHDSDEIKQLMKDWKLKQQKIKGSFYDGGDYYSSWTFEGPRDKIEKLVRDNWDVGKNQSLEDLVEEIGGDIEEL